jgi:hypothetical protein
MPVNEDQERKERFATLIRENVKPKGPRTPLEMLLELASIDAQRMKVITDLFAIVLSQTAEETNTPPAPRRRRKRPNNVVAIDSKGPKVS